MGVFSENLFQHIEICGRLVDLEADISRAASIAAGALAKSGKIMLCGNGGSAADSQHLAAEFTGRFLRDRRPLSAIALSTDSSALTCIGNDYSFDEVFARQVQALGRGGDVLIAISTSGNSINVIRAVEEANSIGVLCIGLLGNDGGKLAALCELCLIVPSSVTARIQECHILIGHTLCGLVEQELGVA